MFNVSQLRTLIIKDILERRQLIVEPEKHSSVSIQHSEKFKDIKHTYGKSKIYSGACDRIAARIRIGYRHPWQIVTERNGEIRSEIAKCPLCLQENANKLDHYILTCPKLKPFRPEGKKYFELCIHFCQIETLLPILTIFPGFKM